MPTVYFIFDNIYVEAHVEAYVERNMEYEYL